MDQEIKEGRGCGPNKDYVLLKLDPPGRRDHHKRLPSVFEIGHNFANVDITKEPIPVVPTIHYQMGGIPTNIHGQVVTPDGQRQARATSGQRPVCRGRMRLRVGARRQPPGHQLAARPAGVWPRGGQPHRRVQRQEQNPQAAARRCR
jgi:succinate dehydrogenase/fumarate reductase flavoprotein subunit